ncbi:hypothetical protein [Paenibacillus sp. 276b]|uniref:hypothetical protein n=1 Tax=Paenibacillus sp. 276b TaxID=1566277 RepID=UPI00089932EB|nr:hypothetical protein [Paenibacillus sp. 276b]SEB27695.1 hypothetical protein SAMN03159332_6373 [Paenibacillus sp. 276b]
MPKKMKISSEVKGNYQGSMTLDLALHQPRVVSVRCCPNDEQHIVRGNCFLMGGRTWYCPMCGIEWIASLRTGTVRYLQIDIEGSTELIKSIPLIFFNEYRQSQEYKNNRTDFLKLTQLMKPIKTNAIKCAIEYEQLKLDLF